MQKDKHEAIRPEQDAPEELRAPWERPSLQRLGAALAEAIVAGIGVDLGLYS